MSSPTDQHGLRPAKPSYGSTGSASSGPEHEALIGEGLVSTDNEEELSAHERRGGETIWRLCSDSLLNLQGSHPVGRFTRILLVVCMAVCMGALAWVLKKPIASSDSAEGGNSSKGRSGRITIPFPKVDRASYSQPASAIVNPDLFHPDLLHSETKRRLAEGNRDVSAHPFLVVPFPTGAFWTNLVVKPTSDRGLSYPVVSYPYAFKWSDTLLQASYPPLRRRIDSISIRDTFVPDMTFSTTEKLMSRYVVKFDPLSVTTRFQTGSDGYWESYLVQGSPYITIKYEKATPVLRALSIFNNVICPFDADGNYNDGTADGGSNHSSKEFRDLKWGVCSSVQVRRIVNIGYRLCMNVCLLISMTHIA